MLGRVFILASAFYTFNVLIDPLGLVLIAAIPCMNIDRRISLEAGHRGGDLLGVAEHDADIRLARRQGGIASRLIWRPSIAWSLAIATAIVAALAYIPAGVLFIYFQF